MNDEQQCSLYFKTLFSPLYKAFHTNWFGVQWIITHRVTCVYVWHIVNFSPCSPQTSTRKTRDLRRA